jgi:oxygen-dependent protoporphyrinogen oxidase
LISFKRGMSTRTDAMPRSRGEHIRYGVDVRAVERRAGGGYRVRTAADGVLEADAVVVSVPAYAAARLVEGLDAELAAMLGAVEHGRLDVATMAWARSSIPHPMNGTGFVVAAGRGAPPSEARWGGGTPRAITGCTWTTESWPGRAPDGLAMLRCFAAEEDASDEELLAAMRRDLRDLMGIEPGPVNVHLRRRARVLPRYEVGCMERVAAMRERATAHAGFALAGNAHGGVGVPDCIESAEAAARAVGRSLADGNDSRRVARTKSVATPALPR